jgi:hypothetical protein
MQFSEVGGQRGDPAKIAGRIGFTGNNLIDKVDIQTTSDQQRNSEFGDS